MRHARRVHLGRGRTRREIPCPGLELRLGPIAVNLADDQPRNTRARARGRGAGDRCRARASTLLLPPIGRRTTKVLVRELRRPHP